LVISSQIEVKTNTLGTNLEILLLKADSSPAQVTQQKVQCSGYWSYHFPLIINILNLIWYWCYLENCKAYKLSLWTDKSDFFSKQ